MTIVNESSNTCWGFWNCPIETMEKCGAYKAKMGHECWLVASSGVGCCPKAEGKGIMYCAFKCDFYKRMNPEKKGVV